LFCETSTIEKRVLKKVRAIVKMQVNFSWLAAALRAGWVAGHDQRSAWAVEEKGSISTSRRVDSIMMWS
jgi:hypothetical protein